MNKHLNRPLLANQLWMFSCYRKHRRFLRQIAETQNVQESYLKTLLNEQANTAYGKSRKFSRVSSYREFCSKIPLTTYDDYQRYIRRIRRGEQNILTREKVKLLEPTSGTTTATKLIPYNDRLRKEFQAAISVWIFNLYQSYPQIKRGPAYWAVSPNTVANTSSEDVVPIGFDSDAAYLSQTEKWLVGQIMAVPQDLRLVSKVTVFQYITLRYLLAAGNLRLISIWNPTFLELLMEALPRWWESLIKDIARGTLSPPAEIPQTLQNRLQKNLRPDPQRATELSALATSVSNPAEIWPKLSLISCWNDAWAAAPAKRLMESFNHARIQPKGLLSTEAFITFPFQLSGGNSIVFPLAVGSHFFEFQSVDSQKIFPSWKLKKGGEYTVFVTTGGGLYRYCLNDRVRVSGYLGTVPTFDFLGKTERILDLRGEKVSEDHLQRVLQRVWELYGKKPKFELVVPVVAEKSAQYTLFASMITADADEIAAKIEMRLQENYHYQHCRNLGQISEFAVIWLNTQQQERLIELRRLNSTHRSSTEKPRLLYQPSSWLEKFMVEFKGEIQK